LDIGYLDYIQFYPTTRCNLSCSFCFNRGVSSRADVELSDYQVMVSSLADAGVNTIDILGGEPTLHNGIREILEINANKALHTSISSNGSDIEFLRYVIAHYSSSSVQVGLSLYSGSMTDDMLDFIKQNSPVVKSVCTRKELIPDEGVMVLNNADVDYCLIFMDALNTGDLDKCLSFNEYRRKLDVLKDSYERVDGVFCSGFIPDRKKYPLLENVRCPAGTTKLSVLPDGSVYPCYLFFRHEEFMLGNVLHDDMHDMVKSPVLDFFRSFEKNECINVTCDMHDECHGGCPAVSLSLTGNLSASDPRCVEINYS
jgi:radical SAM protein with 4Fe4S-binding SPASM domain